MGQCTVEFKVPLTIRCKYMKNKADLDLKGMVICTKRTREGSAGLVTAEFCANCNERVKKIVVNDGEAEVN